MFSIKPPQMRSTFWHCACVIPFPNGRIRKCLIENMIYERTVVVVGTVSSSPSSLFMSEATGRLGFTYSIQAQDCMLLCIDSPHHQSTSAQYLVRGRGFSGRGAATVRQLTGRPPVALQLPRRQHVYLSLAALSLVSCALPVPVSCQCPCTFTPCAGPSK